MPLKALIPRGALSKSVHQRQSLQGVYNKHLEMCHYLSSMPFLNKFFLSASFPFTYNHLTSKTSRPSEAITIKLKGHIRPLWTITLK